MFISCKFFNPKNIYLADDWPAKYYYWGYLIGTFHKLRKCVWLILLLFKFQHSTLILDLNFKRLAKFISNHSHVLKQLYSLLQNFKTSYITILTFYSISEKLLGNNFQFYRHILITIEVYYHRISEFHAANRISKKYNLWI